MNCFATIFLFSLLLFGYASPCRRAGAMNHTLYLLSKTGGALASVCRHSAQIAGSRTALAGAEHKHGSFQSCVVPVEKQGRTDDVFLGKICA
jgi:hypothetical protein